MVARLMPYTLSVYGLSDVGLVRKNNEDVWGSMPEHHLYTVADGMGGHQAGEVAAREATSYFLKSMKEELEKKEKAATEDLLRYHLEKTNHFVYDLSRSHELLYGMGTTICCLYFAVDTMFFAHIGDSRIYRMRKGVLTPLTKDHSLLYEMIDMGQIPDKYIEEGNYKNIITRAVGTEPFVEPTVGSEKVEAKDLYLLTTDGLTDLLSNDEIAGILQADLTVEEKVRLLIVTAKKKGGSDNITIVCCEVEEV